jgi:hypothetical protein
MAPEGQKSSQWLCLTQLPREMCSQPIVSKALSQGIIRKFACVLAEITIRKSQAYSVARCPASRAQLLRPAPAAMPKRSGLLGMRPMQRRTVIESSYTAPNAGSSAVPAADLESLKHQLGLELERRRRWLGHPPSHRFAFS